MAIIRGMTTLNTRKRKLKITKAKYKELELQWRAYNRNMKSKGMHELRYDTLEDYIAYCYGLIKHKPAFESKPIPKPVPYRRETVHYPSLVSKEGGGHGTKKESPKYTGTLIKGIATMHKSNAVPVINQKEAEEISRMAR